MNPLFYILDDNCIPVPADMDTLTAWVSENKNNRSVAFTEITPDVVVSTIFLGVDQSFGRPGGPILFETMVFNGHKSIAQDRYRTWAEALKGHEAMVDKIRAQITAKA